MATLCPSDRGNVCRFEPFQAPIGALLEKDLLSYNNDSKSYFTFKISQKFSQFGESNATVYSVGGKRGTEGKGGAAMEEIWSWTGTGFWLSDGRTTCAVPVWDFIEDQ